MTTPLENEYRHRINRALDYIEQHLEQPMTLDEISQEANFSKYHFSRIFHGMTGETPFQFINRLRLEKAASSITTHPNIPLSEAGIKCGFPDPSTFSRNFKSHFGVSPTRYRSEKNEKSNIHQVESNEQQDHGETFMYICSRSQTIKWRTNMKLNQSVEVTKLPKMTLAYVRHIGPYKGNSQLFEKLWQQLMGWAGPRGLIGGPDFKSLIIYHDDPGVTNEEKLRTSVCITVPPDTKTEGAIGKMELEDGQYAIARFVIGVDEFQQAWDWVCGQWLPSSGYVPDDKPCFEMYPEEPKDGKFTVDICIPVRPM
ncbi:MAG: AraC family transcriptional regulator [Marinilabiliaceae bacterium]|nr:AraC family transcriptional regulator [Marinilabiliaceae bacterium]